MAKEKILGTEVTKDFASEISRLLVDMNDSLETAERCIKAINMAASVSTYFNALKAGGLDAQACLTLCVYYQQIVADEHKGG